MTRCCWLSGGRERTPNAYVSVFSDRTFGWTYQGGVVKDSRGRYLLYELATGVLHP
jgi:hypothetical protein